MGVIEQVSRYDEHVNAVRAATQKHFAERAERSIRRLQQEGVADPHVDPAIAAMALGAMVARFAELWLAGLRQLRLRRPSSSHALWCNALRWAARLMTDGAQLPVKRGRRSGTL
jgi:hypothetical protein